MEVTKINKEEFLKRIRENTFFEDTSKIIEYRYPCLVFFKEEYLPKMQTAFGPAHLLFGNEEYDDTKFTAVNRAWKILIENKDKLTN